MLFSRAVLDNIQRTIGHFEPESGGIIAINQNGVVSDFYFDEEAGFGKASYIPTRSSVQNYIRTYYSSPDLRFYGIVHSHPLCNTCEPSYVDVEMAHRIMDANFMKSICLFMVKGTEMRAFLVTADKDDASYIEKPIEIIADSNPD